MEPQLGADLSSVRVSASGDSATAAEQLGARAFTVENDIHFAAGQYKPGSKEGDRLLAHELTHAVQGQRQGIQRKEAPGAQEAGGEEGVHAADVSEPGELAEKEADAVADQVADKLHGERKPQQGADVGRDGVPSERGLTKNNTREAVMKARKLGTFKHRALILPAAHGKAQDDPKKPGALAKATTPPPKK